MVPEVFRTNQTGFGSLCIGGQRRGWGYVGGTGKLYHNDKTDPKVTYRRMSADRI